MRKMKKEVQFVMNDATAPMVFAQQEFNKHRKLFIENVPSVSHQEVRQFLQDIVPADIIISKRFQHVIITLKCSSEVDRALQILPTRLLGGYPVKVELYPRRMMLYVGGIPLHYNNDMYRNFLSAYGEVETAFLSVTSQGDSKGYGFVEFAHNRATLEQVESAIHGRTLECNVLYCALVPPTMRAYEDTYSRTLYSVCSDNELANDPELAKIVQIAETFNMADRRTLYILECPTVQASEQLWYYHRSVTRPTSSGRLEYAIPAMSTEQIAGVITTTERRYPTADNKEETRCVLYELFPANPELVNAIEGLLHQMEGKLGAQQLTPNVIMNFVSFLTLSKTIPPAQMPVVSIPPPSLVSIPPPPVVSIPPPNVSVPPPAIDNLPPSHLVNTNLRRRKPAMSINRPVAEHKHPVTRSRGAVGVIDPAPLLYHERLITNECEKRGKVIQNCDINQNITGCLADMDQNTLPPARDFRLPLDSPPTSVVDENGLLPSFAGPMTRQRRRTLENIVTPPYRKSPGAQSKKRERPVLFEADLNTALPRLFSRDRRRTMTSTPKVLKRLLPEPEASPGTPRLIGQHSQGIGGHYADSYRPSKGAAALAAARSQVFL